jgi:hypothetical protein
MLKVVFFLCVLTLKGKSLVFTFELNISCMFSLKSLLCLGYSLPFIICSVFLLMKGYCILLSAFFTLSQSVWTALSDYCRLFLEAETSRFQPASSGSGACPILGCRQPTSHISYMDQRSNAIYESTLYKLTSPQSLLHLHILYWN